MVDPRLLTAAVEEILQGGPLFLVSVQVTPDACVRVDVDSPTDVDIDQCVQLSRRIRQAFDPDDPAVGDYELEVGSAGLTAPFTVMGQWLKNVGQPVEVFTADGRKLTGTLTEVAPAERRATVEVPTKVRPEGAKRPRLEMVPHVLDLDRDVRQARAVIDV